MTVTLLVAAALLGSPPTVEPSEPLAPQPRDAISDYETSVRTMRGLRGAGIASSIASHVVALVFAGVDVASGSGDLGYLWVIPVAGPLAMGSVHCARGTSLCSSGALLTMWQVGSLATWFVGAIGLDRVRSRRPNGYVGKYALELSPTGPRVRF